MELATIIGMLAGLLTTGAFLPQIIKTFKTKDVRSISLGMYIVYLLGVGVWFVYGFMINQTAIILCNFLSFTFGMVMLVMKIIYGKNK